MRHGSSSRRQRNRGGNSPRRQTQNRNKVFDSNGPDVRIRGTAHQVAEKYEALAKDASSAGDHTLAQSYMQHAEHYVRIIAAWDEEAGVIKQKEAARDDADFDEEEDDLSLPLSALGPEVKATSEEMAEMA